MGVFIHNGLTAKSKGYFIRPSDLGILDYICLDVLESKMTGKAGIIIFPGEISAGWLNLHSCVSCPRDPDLGGSDSGPLFQLHCSPGKFLQGCRHHEVESTSVPRIWKWLFGTMVCCVLAI